MAEIEGMDCIIGIGHVAFRDSQPCRVPKRNFQFGFSLPATPAPKSRSKPRAQSQPCKRKR